MNKLHCDFYFAFITFLIYLYFTLYLYSYLYIYILLNLFNIYSLSVLLRLLIDIIKHIIILFIYKYLQKYKKLAR